MINAKREALDVRTEQANRIIAKRIQQEEKLAELSTSLGEKDDEIKRHRGGAKATPSAMTFRKARSRLRRETAALGTAKEERSRLAKDLQSCADELAKIALQEKEATKAKEKAEGDYTKALKDTVIIPPKDGAKGTPAPPPGANTGIKPVQTQEIDKALDANKQQLYPAS